MLFYQGQKWFSEAECPLAWTSNLLKAAQDGFDVLMVLMLVVQPMHKLHEYWIVSGGALE